MTKKDYVLIADVLKEAISNYTDIVTLSAIDSITQALADRLKLDNDRFNRSKFLEYVHKEE